MSFLGLYTGLSGVRTAQVGIDVASNNVANAATPGYTRQRIEQTFRPSSASVSGPIGTGVDVASISRLRDRFLDDRARTALGGLGAAGVRADTLARLEALTDEPDAGISVRLTAVWSAADAWANDPADTAARRNVLSELGALTARFGSVAAEWDRLADDATAERDARVTAAGQALTQLAELDRLLVGGGGGAELHDQRDLLLDEVAHLTGAIARVGADGRSEVVLGGVALIGPDGPGSIAIVDGSVQVTGADGTPVATTALGGQIGGLSATLTVDLPAWRAELDAVATAVADAINAVNTGGVTADGSSGGPLVAFDPTDPAGSLRVTTTDPAALAAAAAGDPPAAHDGSNARALADLRVTPVPDGAGGTRRLDDRFADLVVSLAGDVRTSRSAAAAARAVASSAVNGRDAEHGVSLDEEMVGLIRYQRALEAASRVMTTVDEALDVLVNRTGVVGR